MMRDAIGYWMGKKKKSILKCVFFIRLPAAKPGVLHLNQSCHNNNKNPDVSVLSLDIMDHTPVPYYGRTFDESDLFKC